jgi:hypothetical protein
LKEKCDTQGAQKALLFNFFVAFYYEATLELCISIFSALPHAFKPVTYFEYWSASLTWFFIVTQGLFLIIFIFFVFLPWPDPALRMKKHEERVGAIYTNIDYNKVLNRLIPMIFILKRIAFAVGCWYIKLELVTIFIVITLLNLCLIIHAKPYLELSVYKSEIFNESIALVFFTLLQAFKP